MIYPRKDERHGSLRGWIHGARGRMGEGRSFGPSLGKTAEKGELSLPRFYLIEFYIFLFASIKKLRFSYVVLDNDISYCILSD